ncbi:MAG TPA: metalloregulator ArsR/SmtB family transcription factor [Gemmatimonadaceae bacterium]|nr:metalloregulator ArsR/SmtB family transcription factor [Gemmatimonadaceae bacterium]
MHHIRMSEYEGNQSESAIPVLERGVVDLDSLFRGFADPTRLRILNVLAAGELCVSDIVELVELPQPAVSRHLAYLRRSGLVEVTRDWKLGRYRLAEPRDPVHRSLIECVRSCFTGVPSMDAERRRAELQAAERDALRPARARAAPRRRRTLTTGFSPTG